jgi:hypothetical protein
MLLPSDEHDNIMNKETKNNYQKKKARLTKCDEYRANLMMKIFFRYCFDK